MRDDRTYVGQDPLAYFERFPELPEDPFDL